MQLDGVLFFPVTPFTGTGEVAEDVLAEHVKRGVDAGPGGVFVACGTGEFHALEPGEYERVVQVAVEATAGRVPVLAGAGGSLPLAKQFAAAAKRAGADGLLLLPPYLVGSRPEGLAEWVRQIAASTDLPVIVYQRNNAVFSPETAVEVAKLPNVVGFKDGLGDLDLMQRIVLAVRAEVDTPFQFFNGLPTAEMTVPAYRGIGVALYSSAVFCFAPEISLAFYRAVEAGDTEKVGALLHGFYGPLVALRDKSPGYAVSLVKAAVRQRGLDCGGVRAPLTDPAPEHLAELEKIVAAGLELV
ncbi:5-dehydro-4-deoxyglucarate dehydratase [Crossiella sp. CA-258035]|uniref:5-dehydro-4-deoxyglucarate dehydratase n=1 Tax=Crossiella sp. CA-258035 TaxID=2981138 RepID=UPI0024BC140A|nr:5-dehydro-4-deoxyglucarate dehydratase [Crossiella sp. CA-258035]WHT21456.1 5-dehydro-4-deoxyglucarate dehydratase [Crossiella sp. CA-258035]